MPPPLIQGCQMVIFNAVFSSSKMMFIEPLVLREGRNFNDALWDVFYFKWCYVRFFSDILYAQEVLGKFIYQLTEDNGPKLLGQTVVVLNLMLKCFERRAVTSKETSGNPAWSGSEAPSSSRCSRWWCRADVPAGPPYRKDEFKSVSRRLFRFWSPSFPLFLLIVLISNFLFLKYFLSVFAK